MCVILVCPPKVRPAAATLYACHAANPHGAGLAWRENGKVRWQKTGPTEAAGFWPIVVGTGLTFNDAQTTGKHSDVAREVLDMMWTVQRADGGWNWPHCDYAPMEIEGLW